MLVFTYGTLRPSLYPHVERRFNVKLVGPAILTTKLQMVSLGPFPALVCSPNYHDIVGELVETETLSLLDGYEGYRNDGRGLYDRTELACFINGVYHTAWVYYMKSMPPNSNPIESGDWSKR
jgi:gamma-glutamylcyclotransferase (GGCT)/AIG2-like uncharacterized protein YtfP